MTPIGVSNIFSTPGLHFLTIGAPLPWLSAISIIMMITYNKSFCLKVSKKKLPIDGVNLVMYLVPE
jgi:hypothetical protein